MAGSRRLKQKGPPVLLHMRDALALPDISPGSLGRNDRGDPSRFSLLGDTPGTLGIKDGADPNPFYVPGLQTLGQWAQEMAVHIPPKKQASQKFPAGKRDEVLKSAGSFISVAEQVPEHPYLPKQKGIVIGHSGVTIGAGYDLGQHTEDKIRKDWADLDKVNQPYATTGSSLGIGSLQTLDPPASDSTLNLTFPVASPRLRLFTPLDRIAHCAGLKRDKAERALQDVADIFIPKELSIKIFNEITLPETYDRSANFFKGFTNLPAGVQVALLSMFYNRGISLTWNKQGKLNEAPVNVPSKRWEASDAIMGLKSLLLDLGPESAKFGEPRAYGRRGLLLDRSPKLRLLPVKPKPKNTKNEMERDWLGDQWEKSQLKDAIKDRDLVWIYWYMESSRRIWAYKESDRNLVNRRDEELELILPYVSEDLKQEAFAQMMRNL